MDAMRDTLITTDSELKGEMIAECNVVCRKCLLMKWRLLLVYIRLFFRIILEGNYTVVILFWWENSIW
jgi:hypothetical protein